jgi:hypothetical protein
MHANFWVDMTNIFLFQLIHTQNVFNTCTLLHVGTQIFSKKINTSLIINRRDIWSQNIPIPMISLIL